MRPESIIAFERLFLASLALSLVLAAMSYEQIERAAAAEPGLQQLGLGSGFLIGTLAVSYAVYLLLWYLIARKAVGAAKWVLAVLVTFGVLFSLPSMLQAPMGLTMLLSLAAYALEVAAVVYLFRADASAWFKGEHPSDPSTLD